MTEGFAWDAALSLVRWQRTRRGYDGDANLLRAGFALLQSDADGQFGPLSALSRAERAFNLPWQRVAAETLQFAVFLVTKAKRDEQLRPEQTRQGLRLLQLALNVFAVKGIGGDAQLTTLPLNSCNLLLSALSETLEKTQKGEEKLQTLKDVNSVFLFLFGLSSERTSANFQMYRPPTNVYADFLKRASSAVFESLTQLQKVVESDEKTQQQKLYVDLLHATLFVFQELQKTQTNKKKVFLAIAKTSLRNIVMYRHELVKLQKDDVPGVENAIALLDHVVEDALFDAEHIRQYDGAMVHAAIWKKEGEAEQTATDVQQDNKSKKRRKAGGAKASSGLVSYQKNLFDELLNFLSDAQVTSELKASVGGFFEVLVRGFATRIRAAANTKIEDTKTDLKTSRKRAAIVIATTSTTYSPFKFWSELCAVAFSAFQQEGQKNNFLPVLVTLYNALFRALCESDVYRVTEDTEEREQFHIMEKVLTSFLDVLDVEHSDKVSYNADRAVEECEAVSSAVKCSPNLVNCCLVPIFELLGVQALRSFSESGGKMDRVTTAASSAVVELIHAYDSMRLLDAFLKSAFAIQRAHDGLYKLFALSSCEDTLRKAFMALPPGQMDVLWNLLVEEIASFASTGDDMRNARGVALARLLFQTFVQEIHVVPQNRSKVLGLVSHTHEKLLSSFAGELDEVTGPFTPYQRELFCVFGELLMYDSVLNPTVREQTFDQMFAKLEGDRFGTVMGQLLKTSTPSAKKKKKASKPTSADGEPNGANTSHGLGAAGIVKLCVFWLRKMGTSTGTSTGTSVQVSRAGREQVTQLVIEYVINWKCWETVSFHLPELMMNASNDECDHFLREILSAFIDAVNSGELDNSAKRIMSDAGFYEISSLRKVAPGSLTAMCKQFVDEVQHGSLASLEKALSFFSFLLELPAGYLKPEECGDLLVTSLSLYEAIKTSEDSAKCNDEDCRTLLTWIEVHFKIIGMEVHKSLSTLPELEKKLRNGAHFILSQLVIDSTVSVSLTAKLLGYFSDIGAKAFVGELLGSVLSSKKTAKKNASEEITNKLKRSVIVVEALAQYRGESSNASKEEKEFVESVVDIVTREKLCETTNGTLSFAVLNALLQYQSVLHKQAHTSQAKTVAEGPVLQLLAKHTGSALASSMKLVVATSNLTEDVELQSATWSFFTHFCEEYASFRSFVTPLKTYGCLLAVSMTLVSRDSAAPLKQKKAELALQAVLTNANKDEFRLMITTIVQELTAHEGQRKLGALRAVCSLLGGDRKLNAARRLLLNERKESLVEGLLQNIATQSLPMGVELSEPTNAVALRVWNLKAFVLVFCKTELFTWKTHELQHVFTGFQPLVAAVSCWQAGTNAYNPEELHELWTLSYTLLLRIVRNHFASLVNGIPHLVQAANGLLQMLVLASGNSEYSKHCSEWSSNLARLYGYMKEHDVQLRKHVVYLLMTFLVGVTRDKLAVRYQQKLRPGVFALLDVCSPYEKDQLYGALDSTGKSLLKTLDTSYKLTHRYVGKV